MRNNYQSSWCSFEALHGQISLIFTTSDVISCTGISSQRASGVCISTAGFWSRLGVERILRRLSLHADLGRLYPSCTAISLYSCLVLLFCAAGSRISLEPVCSWFVRITSDLLAPPVSCSADLQVAHSAQLTVHCAVCTWSSTPTEQI